MDISAYTVVWKFTKSKIFAYKSDRVLLGTPVTPHFAVSFQDFKWSFSIINLYGCEVEYYIKIPVKIEAWYLPRWTTRMVITLHTFSWQTYHVSKTVFGLTRPTKKLFSFQTRKIYYSNKSICGYLCLLYFFILISLRILLKV